MRYLVLGGLLGTLLALALRALRGATSQGHEQTWQRADSPAWDTDPTVTQPDPVDPVPPTEADPVDREIESRLDDESKYDRMREAEEEERAAVAARLQAGSLTERLAADET